MEPKVPSPISNSDRAYYIFALRVVGSFGATIAIPVVLLVLLGKYLEEMYGFSPWGRATGFVVAAVFSSILIFRKAKAFGSEYQQLIKKK